jgi:hypothetical protein
MGFEGIKDMVRRAWTTFPDYHEELEELVAEGDTVVARFMITGTGSRCDLRRLSCCVSSMGRWWDSVGLWTRFTRSANWESCRHREERDQGGVLHSRPGVVLSSSCGGTAHGPPTPEPGSGADRHQRPLRSRFRQQQRRSVMPPESCDDEYLRQDWSHLLGHSPTRPEDCRSHPRGAGGHHLRGECGSRGWGTRACGSLRGGRRTFGDDDPAACSEVGSCGSSVGRGAPVC